MNREKFYIISLVVKLPLINLTRNKKVNMTQKKNLKILVAAEFLGKSVIHLSYCLNEGLSGGLFYYICTLIALTSN